MTIEFKNIEFFLKKIDESKKYNGDDHLITDRQAKRWFEDIFKNENNVDENGDYIFIDEIGMLKKGERKSTRYRVDAIEKVIEKKKDKIEKAYLRKTTLDTDFINQAKKAGYDPRQIIINNQKLNERRIPKSKKYEKNPIDQLEMSFQILEKNINQKKISFDIGTVALNIFKSLNLDNEKEVEYRKIIQNEIEKGFKKSTS
ncbi:hypothetical protein FEZ48_10815 [Marinilactibacillus psychrotolerans]|uniref:Uncharacterized protein n=1 Tax=Marinilactibacillus psychrotolerans TaxID=191770 RepID=A0A5R9C0H9_9LACT|nr:hypothetical protein [Marinilactibacillus psychrotolerans]TLQ06186.1 hypothetical protein FEZ48_10815 [Marinilactibacillus psychrotolerans]